MCRLQRRIRGKNGDGIIYSVCFLPTVFFASVIVIPVVNDFSVIAQNLPLCAGFQCIDGEVVAFCIGIIKVVTGHFGVVVINLSSSRKRDSATFVVDAAADIVEVAAPIFVTIRELAQINIRERGHFSLGVVFFDDTRVYN